MHVPDLCTNHDLAVRVRRAGHAAELGGRPAGRTSTPAFKR